MMKVYVNAVTDVGCKRPHNEDNFCVNRHFKPQEAPRDRFSVKSTHDTIAAVYDGIGGEAAGEVASFIAAKTTARFDGFLPEVNWDLILNETNERINAYAEQEGISLGCTAALLYYRSGKVDICNLGDSRIYRYTDGKLQKVSKDHTELQRAIDMNLEGFDPEKSGIRKNRLTKYLGINSTSLNPFTVKNMEVSEEDLFLLCSDGLTDMVTEEEIQKIIAAEKTEELAEVLVKKALENGGKDNVTVITVSFTSEKSFFAKLFQKD